MNCRMFFLFLFLEKKKREIEKELMPLFRTNDPVVRLV